MLKRLRFRKLFACSYIHLTDECEEINWQLVKRCGVPFKAIKNSLNWEVSEWKILHYWSRRKDEKIEFLAFLSFGIIIRGLGGFCKWRHGVFWIVKRHVRLWRHATHISYDVRLFINNVKLFFVTPSLKMTSFIKSPMVNFILFS